MKYGFIIACGLFLFSISSKASDAPKNGILTNVGTVVIGNYEVFYERRLDKHFSISASAIYYDTRKVLLRVFSYGYFLGLGFSPKFHLFGKAHDESFYLAPSLRLGYVDHPKMDESQSTHRGVLTRFAATFGYQKVFDCGLMLDLSAGIDYYYTFNFGPTSRFQSSSEKLRFDLRPYAAANIGYAF